MKRLTIFGVLLTLSLALTAKTELKLMSYNIRHGNVEKSDTGVKAWDVRKPASIAMIREQKPDVIGFQEMKICQKEYLVAQLPEYQAVDESPDNTKFIMFRKDRFEQLEMGNFWLSETPNIMSKGWGSISNRAALWVKLRDRQSNKTFYFCDTHLDVKSAEAREKGAALIISELKKICGKKATQFLVGDMNSFITDDSFCEAYIPLKTYETWMKSSRKTAKITDNRPTYNGFGKAKHPELLDHIFLRNAKALKYEIIDGKNFGVEYISDHYPIMATIQF